MLLQSQVAANTRGVALLQGLVAEYGLDVISAYMGHIQVPCVHRVREDTLHAVANPW